VTGIYNLSHLVKYYLDLLIEYSLSYSLGALVVHSAGKSHYAKFDFCDCTRKFGFVITFEIVLWLKLHM